MLKYSSYQSIHPTVHITGNKNNKRYINLIEAKGFRRLTVLIFMVIVTCTGMITAFASSGTHNTPNVDYMVQSGDTLWSIAAANKPNGADIRSYIHEIMKENSMSVSNLEAGEVINLPVE